MARGLLIIWWYRQVYQSSSHRGLQVTAGTKLSTSAGRNTWLTQGTWNNCESNTWPHKLIITNTLMRPLYIQVKKMTVYEIQNYQCIFNLLLSLQSITVNIIENQHNWKSDFEPKYPNSVLKSLFCTSQQVITGRKLFSLKTSCKDEEIKLNDISKKAKIVHQTNWPKQSIAYKDDRLFESCLLPDNTSKPWIIGCCSVHSRSSTA
jgi:hypothetical protein